ncbi:MerR family transcriptional regulator [Pseudokordiimonas caeni]|uniref:MerR family transcriptional regulator n=1 Tax=Pseudokordiimonas caeni TaxID=2997908 RepID=UPI0028124BFC|nr:MerR family DNA-binding transcriptional regulator [Pseudokordiimonas caeni]
MGELAYSIKDLAAEFGITARTLRHYEEQGLVAPARVGQNRTYSAADRVRIAWILRGRRVGFSLSEIADMLRLYELGDGRETQRQVTLAKCRERIAALEAQRADIDETITELTGFCDTLENLVPAPGGRWVRKDTGEPPQLRNPWDG